MTAYTGYQVDSTVLQERQAVGQTQEQGSTPESFTCTTNEQPTLEQENQVHRHALHIARENGCYTQDARHQAQTCRLS